MNIIFSKSMGFLHRIEDVDNTIKDANRSLDYFTTVCYDLFNTAKYLILTHIDWPDTLGGSLVG